VTLTGEIPPNVTGYHAVDLLWTLADSRRARREGWDLTKRRDGLVITPVSSSCAYINEVFETDLQAIEHCEVMAGISTLHARALAIHFYSLATRGK
jgi:hypothetical protein